MKDYPYGSLELGIGMRLYPFDINDPEALRILPVPVATLGGSENNGNSAGDGWYVSNLRIQANRPGFSQGIDQYVRLDPLANDMVNWRGAELDEEALKEGEYRLAQFVAARVGTELDVHSRRS